VSRGGPQGIPGGPVGVPEESEGVCRAVQEGVGTGGVGRAWVRVAGKHGPAWGTAWGARRRTRRGAREHSSEYGSSHIGTITGRRYSTVRLENLYQMDGLIGRGQSGIISLCHNKRTGAKFACKSLYKKSMRSEGTFDETRARSPPPPPPLPPALLPGPCAPPSSPALLPTTQTRSCLF